VPILCRVKFRACLAYILYVSIPCNVGVRVHSGPTYLFYVPCPFRPYLFIVRAVSFTCHVRAVYISGPNCLFAAFFLKFFVSLLPPKNLGEV
jgi:hypothetical protein